MKQTDSELQFQNRSTIDVVLAVNISALTPSSPPSRSAEVEEIIDEVAVREGLKMREVDENVISILHCEAVQAARR